MLYKSLYALLVVVAEPLGSGLFQPCLVSAAVGL